MTPEIKKVRLGLLGAGAWGRRYISTIDELAGVEVARVDSSRWRDALKAPEWDGVIIATPPQLHAEMTLAALEARLPALVEKPLTMDPASAQEVLEAARRLKGIVMVDHIFLFHPAYEALKKHSLNLGPLRAVKTTHGGRGPFRAGVPPLWDWAPHDVALCLDILNANPVSVSASREWAEQTPEGPGENILLRLEFPGSVPAEIRVGNVLREKSSRFEFHFEKGTLTLDDLGPEKLTLDGRSLGFPPGRPLARAVAAFAAAIRAKSPDDAGLRRACDVVSVLAHAQSSLEP